MRFLPQVWAKPLLDDRLSGDRCKAVAVARLLQEIHKDSIPAAERAKADLKDGLLACINSGD